MGFYARRIMPQLLEAAMKAKVMTRHCPQTPARPLDLVALMSRSGRASGRRNTPG